MTSVDPRLLITALGDLRSEGERWGIVARDTVSSAAAIQILAKERANQTSRRASILRTEAEDDIERVANTFSVAEKLREICQDAVEQGGRLLEKATTAQIRAQETLWYWQHELQEALAWLARAEARLATAEADLAAAQAELRAAESDLSYANSRLRACLGDKNRRNCNSERAAVAAAQYRVGAAHAWVQEAIVEVQLAQEEVQLAKARVRCCEQAVGFAEEAVHHATLAHEHAENAINEAECGIEYINAAVSLANTATEDAKSELKETGQMASLARLAIGFADEAGNHQRRADNAAESAHDLLLGAARELANRLERLVEYNAPTLESN